MKRKETTSKTKSKAPKSEEKNKKTGSTKPKKMEGRDSGDDIVGLILRDHEPLKIYLETLKDPDVSFSEKKPVFNKFAPALSAHSEAEEESLYAHLKTEDELRMEGFEGDTEHAIAKRLVEEINDLEQDEDMWMAKVKVLAELVEHHIEEEESELLKEVKKELDLEIREQIGQEYSLLLDENRAEEMKGRTKSPDTNQIGAEYV